MHGEAGERHAHIPKNLRRKTPPVVGDWVVARERRGELCVRSVLPRSTSLQRRAAGHEGRAQILAANLDLVLICTALDRDFRLPRLERWLSLVHEGGARPLILLTKAGLVDAGECEQRLRQAEAIAPGVEVLAIDVLAGLGLDALDRALGSDTPWAQTLAFVGSSGVGKSTLINNLCRGEAARTQMLSASHGKGRHTTSHRELFRLAERALLLIDTPGLREVGLWGTGDGLDATFAELTAIARGCRFSDCAHTNEPGCAICVAVEHGQLTPRRLASWRELAEEREATARRANNHARREHERRFAKHCRATIRAKHGGRNKP